MKILIINADQKDRDAMAKYLMKFLERVCDCPVEFKNIDESGSELETSKIFMELDCVVTIEGRSI